MKDLNDYIIEKLHLNKDINLSYEPHEGDKIMAIIFLSGEKNCILKTGIIKSIFRNTVIVKYDYEGAGVSTMFEIEQDEDYIGKSKDDDLLFDKETAIKLIDDCLSKSNKEIYKNCKIIGDADFNLKDTKDKLLN